MKVIFSILMIFILNSILSFQLVYSQSERLPQLTLGVIPFSHAGIKDYEAISLSNRLHSGLVQTNQFQVIETEKVTALFNEMGLQQAGTCTDERCVSQAGHMLGAQWMVTGTVGKVGSTYSLDIRIIDVESRKIVLSVTRDFKGEIDALLSLMPEIARELAAKTADKLKTGSLEITSTPIGATVYLDDHLKGSTPLEIQELPIGEYDLKITKIGYNDFKERIRIAPLRLEKVDGFMQKLWSLEIITFPEGASINLDHKYIGKTPWSGKLVQGTYKIQLQKPYYLNLENNITLNKNETLQITLEKDLRLLQKLAKSRNRQKPAKTLQTQKSSKKWLWIFGGTVLVGSGIVAWRLMENQKTEEPVEVIGVPPAPPNGR